MKKQVLFIVFFLTISTAAFSQLSLGVKGGLNLANLSGDDTDDTEMRPAFHLGAFANLAFSEKLSLQPELLYNSMGSKTDYNGLTSTLKTSYITIPVNLMYSFGNFNIHAGPQLGFLAGAKMKLDNGSDTFDQDVKDQLKGTDFGFGIGAGAKFGKLNGTVRYVAGLTNISDDDDSDVKNSLIQLSLGYTLFSK